MCDKQNMETVFCSNLKKVESCNNHIKSFYGETCSLQSSLLGQVLLGERLDGSGKNVIKMCMKEMQHTLRDRVLEDPRTEIQVMEKVCTTKHPNFVELMDATEDRKLYCTVQEYVRDGDLCSYIQKHGGLEEDRARRILRQIANAAHYLHENDFCHLDLSLENVLIDLSHDIVKICDFGLCRKLNPNNKNKKFAASHIRPGKPGYTSPEIFNYQAFDGRKSDVWSLGVIIFILLTGFPPFTRPHLNDRCFAYLFGKDCNDLFDKWNLNDKVPPLARDLLNKIFVIEEKRITLEQLLQHPFLDIDPIPSLNQNNNNNNNNTMTITSSINSIASTFISDISNNDDNNSDDDDDDDDDDNDDDNNYDDNNNNNNSKYEIDDKYSQEKEDESDDKNNRQDEQLSSSSSSSSTEQIQQTLANTCLEPIHINTQEKTATTNTLLKSLDNSRSSSSSSSTTTTTPEIVTTSTSVTDCAVSEHKKSFNSTFTTTTTTTTSEPTTTPPPPTESTIVAAGEAL